MIRSILVAVHRSPSTRPAMAMAARLAHQSRAQLKGLYVEDIGRFVFVPLLTSATAPLFGGPPAVELLPPTDLLAEEDRLAQEGKDMAEAFSQVCLEEGLTGEFQTLQGDPQELLLARSRAVDLVVMGHQRGNPSGDSLVERVLRESARPVMVVPDGAPAEGPAVFAYDGSRAAQRSMAIGAALVALGTFRGAHVLTVVDAPEEATPIQREAHEYLAPYVREISFGTHVGDPAEAILSTARRVKAGLVVMGAFGNSAIQELLFGSTTGDVLEEVGCAVLMQG